MSFFCYKERSSKTLGRANKQTILRNHAQAKKVFSIRLSDLMLSMIENTLFAKGYVYSQKKAVPASFHIEKKVKIKHNYIITTPI